MHPSTTSGEATSAPPTSTTAGPRGQKIPMASGRLVSATLLNVKRFKYLNVNESI